MRITVEVDFAFSYIVNLAETVQDVLDGVTPPRMVLTVGQRPGLLTAIEANLVLKDSGLYYSGCEPIAVSVTPLAPNPVSGVNALVASTGISNTTNEIAMFTFGQGEFAEPIYCPAGLNINMLNIKMPRPISSKPIPAVASIGGFMTFVFKNELSLTK